MSENIFETAARLKFRYPSARGDLSTENLFDLPLLKNGFDLDSVARAVNADLKSLTEDSFVASRPNPRKAEMEAKLEVVKHVIAIKQDEAKAVEKARERAAQRAKILDIINSKKDQELSASSLEDLEKRLVALDA